MSMNTINKLLYNESKVYIFPQLHQSWENTINAFLDTDSGRKIIYDIVSFLDLLNNHISLEKVVEEIEAKNYSDPEKHDVIITLAFYHKQGPTIYRLFYPNNISRWRETSLKQYENSHIQYEKELISN